MKPKPFWPLNHFTVPRVMRLFFSFEYMCRQAAHLRSPVCVRDLDLDRQSDACCAARPSHWAETRSVTDSVPLHVSQGRHARAAGQDANNLAIGLPLDFSSPQVSAGTSMRCS